MQIMKHRRLFRGSLKRSLKRSFGNTEEGKGVKLFSDKQMMRDLEAGILAAIISNIISNGSIDASLIQNIIMNGMDMIITDSTFIFAFDKLFGSNRNWDWFYKIYLYILRVCVLLIVALYKTETGKKYLAEYELLKQNELLKER